MIPIPLLVLGVAVGAWWFTRAPGARDHEQDGGGMATGPTLAPGLVVANRSIKVTGPQIAWLVRLRRECSPVLVPVITVTSGLRTVESQTAAMLTYLDEQGKDAFVKLYKTAALELLKVGRSYPAWLPIVRHAYEVGWLDKSGHLAGKAIDLRDHGFPDEAKGRAELTRAAKACGAVIYDDGPAFHAQIDSLELA